jgi:hypothetical protein
MTCASSLQSAECRLEVMAVSQSAAGGGRMAAAALGSLGSAARPASRQAMSAAGAAAAGGPSPGKPPLPLPAVAPAPAATCGEDDQAQLEAEPEEAPAAAVADPTDGRPGKRRLAAAAGGGLFGAALAGLVDRPK